MNSNREADEFDEFTSAKERFSDVTVTSSQDSQRVKPKLKNKLNKSQTRICLFENQNSDGDISQKMSQRAISWLITVCWNKSIQVECLWSTVMLYYSYKARKPMKKNQLELIMITCLNLSMKMHASKKLSFQEFMGMFVNIPQKNIIISKEAEILEMVDFNLVIPNTLEFIIQEYHKEPEKLQKIYFLSELFMIKNHLIFIDDSLMQKLVDVVEENDFDDGSCKKDIQSLLALKQCKIITQKYLSKFDTDAFILNFS